ncbi:hypothetical protein PSECIP111951_02113 [Pseudoalteromonas holothuriae]|uniref:DsDNA-mimic protein n=1 Tax=Pseudoalteromonas holothuriae TaxID=2963714 RepID=A0A9W4QRZ9_9GAMM|nr:MULTISPECIES: YciU family protein [unclassified Pseudoalteromonas]CAH9050658.1 hypothetical protein PSECIP111854_00574 [Pseudoalteromonas sp. CIP111854]CAH9059649.1 hypothetical protein PSECIP111951_02113 [Pseudoalteromonas sp. CIP111951]
MSARLCSVEEITHQAYEIFQQLAPDNLSAKDIEQFNLHHQDYGFIEDSEPDDSWQDRLALESESEHFVQVLVGIEYEDGDEVLANILISRDLDAPFCHVLWKQSETE